MKALVIAADSSQPAQVVDEELTLDYLQGVVGGLIEHIYVYEILTDSGKRGVDCTVFVNEEGKLTGLPVNPRATDLTAMTIGGWYRDVIRGDVIVVGPPGKDGQETACPDNVIDIVREWGWLAAPPVEEALGGLRDRSMHLLAEYLDLPTPAQVEDWAIHNEHADSALVDDVRDLGDPWGDEEREDPSTGREAEI